MYRVTFIALLLGPSLALAGPPAPRMDVDVWSPIPLGAPIRVQLSANCMARIPAGLDKKIVVKRGKATVAGSWSYEGGLSRTTGTIARLKFIPSKPLAAGTYELYGLPRPRGLGRLGGGKPAPWRLPVRVKSVADSTPPSYSGLQGALCRPVNPLLGCMPVGVFFQTGKASDPSVPRFVLYLRRRGRPYDLQKRWEVDGLRFGAYPLGRSAGAKIKPGRYIVTLRAVDRADNEGGSVCEVELRLPLSSCARFPGVGARAKRGAVVRARCARFNRRHRGWRSVIDRVRFKLP